MSRKILVFILMSLLGFSLGFVITKQSVKHPSHKLGSVTVTLIVRQYRGGQLVKQIVREKDPFTKNFVNLMWSLLKNAGGTFTMIDTSGTTRSLYVSKAEPVPLDSAVNRIAIGNGTAPFSINDYALASQLNATTSSTPTESTIGNQINYTISASFSVGVPMNITEVGYMRYLRISDGTSHWFLLMRDVLPTPIQAQAGDVVTVTYIIQINA